MTKMKIAITVNQELVDELDAMVADNRFPSRSQAIESAIGEKLERLRHTRLAHECAKLDVQEEKSIADEGLASELESWPAY
jgi:metal-responsive CopG/Arc/MetJ family transcriptional regulator